MKENVANAGYKIIYEELIRHLKNKDIAASAENLDLALNNAGEVIVPFLGMTFLVCLRAYEDLMEKTSRKLLEV